MPEDLDSILEIKPQTREEERRKSDRPKQKRNTTSDYYSHRLVGLSLLTIGTASGSLGMFGLSFLNPEHGLKLMGFGSVMFLLLIPLGLVIIDKAQSLRQPAEAETLLREDARRPVLYLRAFRNAGADTVQTPFNVVNSASTTDEERLAVVMNQVGPFVAISETGGGKTDFGAARLSVSHDEWQTKVLQMMFSAELIVIRIDPLVEKWGRFYKDTLHYRESDLTLKVVPKPTDFISTDIPRSVWWEIEQAIKIKPERTLFYLPFKGKNMEREMIYEDIARLLQKFVKARLPDKIRGAEFIGFRPDGTPYLLCNKGIRMFGIVNSYGKILEPYFRHIGVYSRRISVNYFRIAELILIWTMFLLAIVMFGSVFLKGIVMFVSKFYPEYEFINA